MQVNTSKAIAIGIAFICVCALMAIHTIGETAGVGLIGPLIGYIVGNGNSAKNGQTAQPIIAPKPDAPTP